MNWIDYIIIAIIVLGMFIGVRKGFIMAVSNIVCLVASVFIAKEFYKPVAELLIKNTKIEDSFSKFLVENNLIRNLPSQVLENGSFFGIKNTAAGDINNFITILIINALAMIIIFVAARFSLSIIEAMLSGFFKLPGLKEINIFGGAVIGLASSVLILMVIFAFVIPMSSFKGMETLTQGIKTSVLANYFYSYNYILGWLWNTALDMFKA